MTALELTVIAGRIKDLGIRIALCEKLFKEHMKAFYSATEKGDGLNAAQERDHVHTLLDSQMDALSSINLLLKTVIEGQTK